MLDVLSEFTHESLAFRVARKLGEAGEGNCRRYRAECSERVPYC